MVPGKVCSRVCQCNFLAGKHRVYSIMLRELMPKLLKSAIESQNTKKECEKEKIIALDD